MKKYCLPIMICAAIVALPFLPAASAPVKAQPALATEKAAHPSIVNAIYSIDDAIAYMKTAPHDFGGHRAAAIAACEEAVRQLKEALKYRETQDRRKIREK